MVQLLLKTVQWLPEKEAKSSGEPHQSLRLPLGGQEQYQQPEEVMSGMEGTTGAGIEEAGASGEGAE